MSFLQMGPWNKLHITSLSTMVTTLTSTTSIAWSRQFHSLSMSFWSSLTSQTYLCIRNKSHLTNWKTCSSASCHVSLEKSSTPATWMLWYLKISLLTHCKYFAPSGDHIGIHTSSRMLNQSLGNLDKLPLLRRGCNSSFQTSMLQLLIF